VLINEKILFELGSLKVYEMTMTQDGKMYRGVYWKDAGSPQGYGPFMDAYEAMKHYEQLIKKFKGLDADGKRIIPEVPMADVIQVDFQAKRRVLN
jgi:hypothetical protein